MKFCTSSAWSQLSSYRSGTPISCLHNQTKKNMKQQTSFIMRHTYFTVSIQFSIQFILGRYRFSCATSPPSSTTSSAPPPTTSSAPSTISSVPPTHKSKHVKLCSLVREETQSFSNLPAAANWGCWCRTNSLPDVHLVWSCCWRLGTFRPIHKLNWHRPAYRATVNCKQWHKEENRTYHPEEFHCTVSQL